MTLGLSADSIYPLDRSQKNDFIAICDYIKKNSGSDSLETVEWALSFESEAPLIDVIADGWKSTGLPLKSWAGQITEVGIFADEEGLPHGAIGIGVRLGSYPGRVVRIEKPVPEHVVQANLANLIDVEVPVELIQLYSFAPGLIREVGIEIASRGFIFAPLDSFARGQSGPTASYEICKKSDIAVWPRERCRMELVSISLATAQRCWVMIDNHANPFFFLDGVTQELTRLRIELPDLIHKFMVEDKKALIASLSRPANHLSETIAFVRTGSAARTQYESLSMRLKLTVFCLVAHGVIKESTETYVSKELQSILGGIRSHLIDGVSISKEIEVKARALAADFLKLRKLGVPKHVILLCAYLPSVVDAAVGNTNSLPVWESTGIIENSKTSVSGLMKEGIDLVCSIVQKTEFEDESELIAEIFKSSPD